MNFSLCTALLAQAADAATETAKTVANTYPNYNRDLVITVAVLAGAIALGYWLAKSLRMPDYGWKLALIFGTFAVTGCITVLGWPPKLGIDLKGGVILVYEVSEFEAVDATKEGGSQRRERNDINDLVRALSLRLNPAGLSDVVIRPYGERQVEIIIPEVEAAQVAAVKELIKTSGKLRFMIVANPHDHEALIAAANASMGDFKTTVVRLPNGEAKGEWVVVQEDRRDEVLRGNEIARQNELHKRLEVLAAYDEYDVRGEDLAGAYKQISSSGGYQVDFTMKSGGSTRMSLLTGSNLPDQVIGLERRLGIVMDQDILSAPSIRGQISDRGQITGGFSEKEVDFLVQLLKSGKLPAVLNPDPVSESQIAPLLGLDTIYRGAVSFVVATTAVFLFMLVYYRFSGVVACLALLGNVLLTLASMIAFHASLTMPGLAGLVLSVGMSVDANVLIYERFREEIAHGAGLRMVIRNGFSRAFNTIVDSNLTTIMMAIVLYWIGTDQIKGFAVTLIFGLVTSLFTALFCSRVLFDIAERKRWITQLKMFQLFGATNIDFMRLKVPCVIGSLLIIVLGMAAAFYRGPSLLDIDFVGGTSVQFLLKQPVAISAVRESMDHKIKDELHADVAVTEIQLQDRARDTVYKVDSSLKDKQILEQSVAQVFGKDLVTHSLAFSEPTAIALPSLTSPGVVAPTAPSKPATEKPVVEKPATAAPITPAEEKPAPEKKPEDEKKPATSEPEKKEPEKPAAEKSESAEKPAEKTAPEKPATENTTPEKPKADEKPAEPKLSAERLNTAADRDEVPVSFLLADEPATPANAAPSKDEPKPEPKVEAKSEAKPEATAPKAEPEAPKDAPTSEPKTEAKPEPKTEPKDEPTAENKPEPNAEPKAEVKPEPQVEPKPETKPEPKAESKPPEGTAEGATAPIAVPVAFRSESELDFGDRKVPGGAVKVFLHEVFTSNHIEHVAFQLPDWDGRSGQPSSKWRVQFTSDTAETKTILNQLHTYIVEQPVWLSSTEVGGQVARKMQLTALGAFLLSFISIVAYVWFRFESVIYGLAGVLALVHDVLVTIGFLAFSYWLTGPFSFLMIDDFKINLPVVAGILTLAGYSINDTVVIYDRIREIRGKAKRLTGKMINDAINQTLSRSVLTSTLTFITVFFLYVLGGQPIHAFSYALLVGIITGSYSTMFIAAPVLLWFQPGTTEAERAT